MSNKDNGLTAENEAAGAWPPDQPVPYFLTPLGEAALVSDDLPADQERHSL